MLTRNAHLGAGTDKYIFMPVIDQNSFIFNVYTGRKAAQPAERHKIPPDKRSQAPRWRVIPVENAPVAGLLRVQKVALGCHVRLHGPVIIQVIGADI